MPGRGEPAASPRSIVYCVIPSALAPKVHEPLRRHFRDDAGVEVVVERRSAERRTGADRRSGESATPEADRRRIRNPSGRRVADRRAAAIGVPVPELPRRLRSYADRLVFVERVAPASEQLEDADTSRLVTRIQAGDREAFGELYLRYFDRVYAYLRIALRNPHDAEDAAQHVFMKVFEALPRYERRRQPFRAWLFRIVRNSALDTLERQGRVDLVEPTELDRQRDGVEDPDVTREVLGWISDRELSMFIERLPAPQRQALALRFMLGLRAAEVAQILGRTPTDVRNLQSRALRLLRERLVALGRTPDDRRRGGIRMRRWVKPAHVLRGRRFALMP
jgi:RNA polymerase sigma-70 factor (ECF subfamily)